MLGWVVGVLVGWSALAVGAAAVIGRMIRLRDRQVPTRPGTGDRAPERRGSGDPVTDRDLGRG